MSDQPPSGYDAFTLNTAFAWLKAALKLKLTTKEAVVQALERFEEEEKRIIPFRPRLAVDNTKTPPELHVTIVFWRDVREEDEKQEQEPNWQPAACFSKEDLAIRYIEKQEGRDYRIAWGYLTLPLDKPE